MSEYRLTGKIGHDEDGYWAECPELQGCYTQGDTYEETVQNLREAITLHIEDRLDCGEDVPKSDSVSLLTLNVAV